MKIHTMKLHKAPFDLIKEGRQQIESRLFDDKRRGLKVGDYIEFDLRNSPAEKIQV